MTEEKKIIAKVEERRGEIIGLLSKLIRIPSRTGEEGEAQAFVANQLRGMRLDVDVWEPDIEELFAKFPQVAQYPSHWQHDLILPYHHLPTYEELARSKKTDVLNYKDRPNVVGRWKGLGEGRSLILNGHIDTVTIEPEEEWTHVPFGAQTEDGKMFGRGTSDMKGGIISAIEAVRTLIQCGVRLRGDVIFESVVNEEHAGNGTLACIGRGITADAVILTEPSKNMIRLGNYGGVYWGINLTGIVKPPAVRWVNCEQNSVSAIEKLPAIINALLDLEKAQNQIPVSPFYSSKNPFAMILGKVWGGSYETATAGKCFLKGCAYFGPDVGAVTEVMASIRKAVMKAAQEDPWLVGHPPEILFFHHDDASKPNIEEAIVKVVSEAGQRALGARVEVVPGTAACDMRHLVNQGKMPALTFGPGRPDQSHTVDEFIELDDLISNVKVLALSIYSWCR
jgi:acetylornithine deacetylase